jgi:hypothetical protein
MNRLSVVRAAGLATSLVVVLGVAACAPTARVRSPLFAQVDAERASPLLEALRAAPEVVEADALRVEALRRDDAGDGVAAQILLETARAKWSLALAKEREREAGARASIARDSAAVATTQRASVGQSEAAESHAIDEAVAKVAAARSKARGTNLEPVVGARDKARRLSAEATILDAAEACAFARVVGVKGPAVDRASALVRTAEKRVGSGTSMLEAAVAARNACLSLHAPDTARQAERRVVALDKGIDAAAAMGLEPARDGIGLTFVLDGTTAELDALASFVRAYGGVTLVVDRRSDPGLSIDVQSTTIAKALGHADGVVQLAPRMALSEDSRRRIVVRVAPAWPAEEGGLSPVTAEP